MIGDSNYFGKLFKKIRESRGLSLQEATGGEFSIGMLSKFENGKTMMTVDKFLTALQNIYVEPSEFFLLADCQSTYFSDDIFKLHALGNIQGLKKALKREQEATERLQLHRLNGILIKSLLGDEVKLVQEEIDFVLDYLFRNDIWGQYDLLLFSYCITATDSELYMRYCREMLGRSDFLFENEKNQNLIHTMLVNGLFLAIEDKNTYAATYFSKQIHLYFNETRDAYMKIVFLYAEGLRLYQRGDEKGEELIEKAIETFDLLGYVEVANTYRSSWIDIKK